MSYKSQSIAKILTALSVLTVLTSGHFGLEWYKKSLSARSTHAKLDKEFHELEQEKAELEKHLTKDGDMPGLDSTLSALMLDVYNNRAPYGITLTSVAPAKLGATSNGMAQASALAEDIPGTSSVKSVKVLVVGTYKTYPELVSYLSTLTKLPVSLVSLKVQDRNFEAGVRMYGVTETK